MSSYSKTTIIGNLGQDPNTKRFENGGQITNFSVATTENWTDKTTGEKRSLTEWHNVTISGKLSEIADKYLSKGDKVLIEGVLRTRKWKGSDGVENYITELHCREMKFMSTKRKETEPESLTRNQETPKQNEPSQDPGDNDDLPF